MIKTSAYAIERCLRIAGWYPGRRVDTTSYEQFYIANRYPILPNVMDFLSQYGGIKFRFEYLNSNRDNLIGDDYKFDPASSIFSGGCAKYSAFVGVPVLVVGSHYGGYAALLMDAEGKFYLGLEHGEANPMASSFEEFVDALVFDYYFGSRQATQLPGV